MNPTFQLGRIAGIRIGINWSWLIIFALIVWSLAAAVFPSQNPGFSDGEYIVLAVVAVVVGIRMLMSSRGTTRAIWNPLIIASLAMSGFVALTSGAAIVSWPAQMDLQQCRDRALTHGAEAACEARFTEDLLGFLSRG